ncbi:hypothetical protein F5B19DRAFT_505806, partial [Rostrohypoxylon terebratum]
AIKHYRESVSVLESASFDSRLQVGELANCFPPKIARDHDATNMLFETVLFHGIARRNRATISPCTYIRRVREGERACENMKKSSFQIFNMKFKDALLLLVLAGAYVTLAQDFANGPFQLHVCSITNSSIDGNIPSTSSHTIFLR